MFNFVRRHKIVSGLILANIIAVIVVVIVIIIHNSKTSTVEFYVTPIDAKVEMNGREYNNLETYDVTPGDYKVKVSMDGMQTREFDITVAENGFVRVWAYLIGEDGTFSYYLTHPNDEEILAELADDEKSKQFVERYDAMASIENELPISYDEYADDYSEYTYYEIELDNREDCPKVRCLTILDMTGNSEQKALDKIREYGYNVEDYDITYENQSNQYPRVGDD